MTSHPDVTASMQCRSSPPYRPGEQEAIAAFRKAHKNDRTKVQICPGFGSGEPIVLAQNTHLSKNGMARTAKRYQLNKNADARELTRRCKELYAEDSSPGYLDRIAGKLGIASATVKRKLREGRDE